MFSPLPFMGITDVWQLVVAAMVFLMLPGPGTFCVLTCTARNGVRGGFASVAGLMLADGMLMFLAAAGVATLLKANPLAFRALQYLGAAYLAWLGVRLLAARGEASGVVPFSSAADFRRGFLVTSVNPKAIVFYMAFFPLFVDPALHQGLVSFAFMALTIAVLTFAYGLTVVLLTRHLAERLRANPLITSLLGKLAGVVLIGFGVKLVASR